MVFAFSVIWYFLKFNILISVYTKSCRLRHVSSLRCKPSCFERVISLERLSNMYVQNVICQIIIDFVHFCGTIAAWELESRARPQIFRPTPRRLSICALALKHAHRNGLPLMCNHANVASFEGTANSSVSAVREKFAESCSRNVKSLQERHRRKNSHFDRPSYFIKFDIISAIWQVTMGLWGTR